ncbi:MAG: MBL fold metallo-hydrolase [Peptococcaceae bacterium]|nr:MBL fold metallo-hydrolase [Peptococcaceae bacterium]
MDYCSLMSGSWGNCHYIRAGETSILIDAGQSGRRILANMTEAGCGPAESLSAIVVTHAHSDHISGLGVLARRLGVEVYATEGTWFEMGALAGEIPDRQKKMIGCSERWAIGSLEMEAFPTSHDALESVGYVVRNSGNALGIATDSGVFTSHMERILRDMRVLVLEANHDLDMLRTGKYPRFLKKRIAGIEGHLSNDDAGQALVRVLGDHMEKVVLAHLSQENNTREKALETVRCALPPGGPELSVAPRSQPSGWIVMD